MKFPDKKKIREITSHANVWDIHSSVVKCIKCGVVSLVECNHPTDGVHKRFTLFSSD